MFHAVPILRTRAFGRALSVALVLLLLPGPTLLLAPAQTFRRGPVPVFAQTPTCGSVTDGQPRSLPALTPPPTGQSYVDPVFGCSVTRLTNAAAEGSSEVLHFYSSVNPFNADSTLVLLQKLPGGIQHVRDLRGNIIRDNLGSFGLNPNSDAFWSRTDPNIIYYHPVGVNELRSYNVAANAMTVLHTFAGYSSVSFGNGEGDLSWDGDHIAVLGDGTYGFIYTISTGTITPVQNLLSVTAGVAVDVFEVTPSNAAVLQWGNANGGVAYFDQAMNFLGKITNWAGHSDRTRDANGGDLEVAVNAADLAPPLGCTNAIVKIRLAATTQTCLRPMDWSLAQHVSCNNVGQDWCLVSTYMGTPGQVAYANELMEVKLDGSQTIRLAHSRSTNVGYDHFPRAAVSADGRYVLFDSDMLGTAVDVYLLTVPTPDTVPPTVSVISPAAGATVSSTVSISATAFDNVGVVGVQFMLDGLNLGAEVTAAPYTISWDTTTAANGGHSLTAAARDAAGNRTISSPVSVTVSNARTDTTPPSVPTDLTATATGSSQIALAWSPSADNVAVAGYIVFRNGARIATASTTGYQDVGLAAGTYTYNVAAYDAAGNASAQSSPAPATTPAATLSPYGGVPWNMPGTVQAENFDNGGEGVAYHDTTPGNQGGLYRLNVDVDITANNGGSVINDFQTGEWLKYTINVTASGTYRVEALVSSPFSTSRFHIEVDGVNKTGSLSIPNTGSWNSFKWVGKGGVTLTAGLHIIRIYVDQQYFNLDAIRIRKGL